MRIKYIIKKLKLSKNHSITLNGLLWQKSKYSDKLEEGDELIVDNMKNNNHQRWCIKYFNKKLHYMHPLQHYYMYS